MTTQHTAGPYRIVVTRTNEDGTPFEAEIVSETVSQNFAAWLKENGKAAPAHPEGRTGWGQVSFGRFHGLYNGSGAQSGPPRMLSDEEAIANAKHTLLCLSTHDKLVEAIESLLEQTELPDWYRRDGIDRSLAVEALELVKRGVTIT